ncbi:hypothetical protein POM88_052406 [Heracleum sosnowskyi]|uniref:BHLH domain-containing protein n=1 Tax=Heracleum sosnowskyi TaxID=360622 RepID=A0AAD8GRK9_9APIA|nr:hypothetical protein POM88_052406 [Heracleum sosnowskyi]
MNDPESPDDSEFQNFVHDLLVPRQVHTNESIWDVEFGRGAERLLWDVQYDDEMTSWMENYNNEFSQFPYVETPPQQAENEILHYEDFSSLMATPQQQVENDVLYDDFFSELMEFIHADQQFIQALTEATLMELDEFVQGEQQLIQPVSGLPQPEATLWQPEPAVNLFHQPVTTPPPPQTENALWVAEPPLHVSDYMPPLEPAMVEPSGFNNNYVTAPAVHNSPWTVSPFPGSYAPIYHEPASEATSVVAAVEGTKLEEGSTSNVKEENQVGEQDDDGTREPVLKRTRETHHEHGRRRRDMIRERMMLLRELVPGCEKLDRASVLEETCTYLKALQDQVNVCILTILSLYNLCVFPIGIVNFIVVHVLLLIDHFINRSANFIHKIIKAADAIIGMQDENGHDHCYIAFRLLDRKFSS